MNELNYSYENELTNTAKFCIFHSRYLLYFYFISINCFYYLFNNPLTYYSIALLICSVIIFCLITFSLFGTIQVFKTIKKWQNNGNNFKLIDAKKQDIKKAYPILFLNIILTLFGIFYPIVSIVLLLLSSFYITYKTKLNSSNILEINPLLRLFFNVYEIEFDDGNNNYKELIISKNKINKINEKIKIYDAGFLWHVK